MKTSKQTKTSIKKQEKKLEMPNTLALYSSTSQKCRTLNNYKDLPTKVGYIQGFINRLRNRATRVATINGEDAYVIKAHDLDECLARLAKAAIDKTVLDVANREETAKLKLSEMSKELEKKSDETTILNNKLEIYI